MTDGGRLDFPRVERPTAAMPGSAPDTLDGVVDDVSRTPMLLVACDFDGTIAPIVSEPGAAEADRECLVALRALSRMPQTCVAIVSGRALEDLAGRMSEVEAAHLVGSHGSEFEAGFVTPLAAEQVQTLDRLRRELRRLVDASPGLLLEEKPASLALHYRNAADSAAQTAVYETLSGPATWPGVHTRHGHKVIELSVVKTDKGLALNRLRQRLGATAVVFLGDDVTDEDAFATLSGPDAGVKVGEGPSLARFRAADHVAVARLLARLSERRAEWLAGASAAPIDHYSLLSDQRTVALIDRRGRIAWMCVPRIDSSAVFAELLGGPTAGFFEVRPASDVAPEGHRYVEHSLVFETRWPGFTLTDYLDCGGGRAFQRAGRTDLVRVIEGRGRVRVTFAPRSDFGRAETRLEVGPAGLVIGGSIDPVVLYAPGLPWRVIEEGRHQTAVAEFDLDGSPVVLEMRYGTASLEPLGRPEPQRRLQTARFWSGWASTLTLPDVAREQVLRSALVLKALTYGPTGAIAAAGTTSLPEHLGGVRNWDYRFCWPRDAAMSATALVRLGATGPAIKYLDWVLGVLERCDPSSFLAPLYTVTGGHAGTEAEISELSGYRGSRPVRVGNAAAHQIQLDVLGPIAELVARLAESGAALSAEHGRMMETMVKAVERRWHEPDHGIWEVRRARRHHVHSKVMCWQTVDRAVQVAEYLGQRRPDWEALRARIAEDVLTHGWSAEIDAFRATYDDHEPDAAVLSVGLSGLIAPDDPRFLRTVDYVERELRAGPTVYRYRYDDGLPGVEGGFHLCTSWLIEALAMVGRRDAAAELLRDFAGLIGATGMLSEEYDPRTGLALGNVPQAYSHLGLINAALALSGAV